MALRARSGPSSPRLLGRLVATLALLPLVFTLTGAVGTVNGPSTVPAPGRFGAGFPFVRARIETPSFQTGVGAPSVGPVADAIRHANARIPFAPAGLASPRPFLLPDAGGTDYARATDCLAAAAYYEAGQGEVDERAVVQVVLNRTRHPAFPKTVCGVVFQGQERSTGCQFTFTCDGAMSRRRPSPGAWERARRIAQEALNGRTEPRVGNATHYHTDWVLPVWSRQMDKIAAVNTHLFFRWRGRQGEPATFVARYAGGEAAMVKMAMLSRAHGAGLAGMAGLPVDLSATAEIAAPVAFVRRSAMPAAGERLPDESALPDPDVFLIALSPTAGSDAVLQQAQRLCAGRSFCRFIGWTDGRRKADRLPMPGSAVDAISFTFTRTALAGPDMARWNCAEFPRSDPAQCLRRGL